MRKNQLQICHRFYGGKDFPKNYSRKHKFDHHIGMKNLFNINAHMISVNSTLLRLLYIWHYTTTVIFLVHFQIWK